MADEFDDEGLKSRDYFKYLMEEREKADETLRESLFDVRRSTLLTGSKIVPQWKIEL